MMFLNVIWTIITVVVTVCTCCVCVDLINNFEVRPLKINETEGFHA